MSLRTRLLLLVTLTTASAVGAATWAVASWTQGAFEASDERRTHALVEQFRREFARRGAELVATADRLAASQPLERIAIDAGGPGADASAYVNDAAALAAEHKLDVAELTTAGGTIISSAHWPARFGYREPWLAGTEWGGTPAFFKREELEEGAILALVAVRTAVVSDRKLHVVLGVKLDERFLSSLVLPAGMRALLYRSLEPGFSVRAFAGPLADPRKLEPLVERVRRERREASQTIEWSDGRETFQALPLLGWGGEVLGILLVGSSRRELAALVSRIGWSGAAAGAAGILLGIGLAYGVSARLTRPVERLAAGARRVASGAWDTTVEEGAGGEIGELVAAFNAMTRQLLEQRNRLVQAERVAAWRELARRLAHELKNPLFPLQITIENLQRARRHAPEQFDEVFREGTATLIAELENLKAIVARFSDFARMPPPTLESVDLNEVVRRTLRLFQAQLEAPGRPPIQAALELDPALGSIQADPAQLGRALQNLVLNAVDAMPSGGRLGIRTCRQDGVVRLEVSDTGGGLTREECERLFTPYYTTKQYGTGLGLAIVQSVVSDHLGKIAVESEPGRGTTFRIELPGGA